MHIRQNPKKTHVHGKTEHIHPARRLTGHKRACHQLRQFSRGRGQRG